MKCATISKLTIFHQLNRTAGLEFRAQRADHFRYPVAHSFTWQNFRAPRTRVSQYLYRLIEEHAHGRETTYRHTALNIWRSCLQNTPVTFHLHAWKIFRASWNLNPAAAAPNRHQILHPKPTNRSNLPSPASQFFFSLFQSQREKSFSFSNNFPQ